MPELRTTVALAQLLAPKYINFQWKMLQEMVNLTTMTYTLLSYIRNAYVIPKG
jgi:hypothetical protein